MGPQQDPIQADDGDTTAAMVVYPGNFPIDRTYEAAAVDTEGVGESAAQNSGKAEGQVPSTARSTVIRDRVVSAFVRI